MSTPHDKNMRIREDQTMMNDSASLTNDDMPNGTGVASARNTDNDENIRRAQPREGIDPEDDQESGANEDPYFESDGDASTI